MRNWLISAQDSKRTELDSVPKLHGQGTTWSRNHKYFSQTLHLGRFPISVRDQASKIMCETEKEYPGQRYRLLFDAEAFLLTVQPFELPKTIHLEVVKGAWPRYTSKKWPREPFDRKPPQYEPGIRRERLLTCAQTNAYIETDCSNLLVVSSKGIWQTAMDKESRGLQGTTLQFLRSHKAIEDAELNSHSLREAKEVYIANAVLGCVAVDLITEDDQILWRSTK